MSDTGINAEIPSVITGGLIAVSVVFPLLSAAAIATRLKARTIAEQRLAVDDWSIVVTWVLAFGLSTLVWVFAGLVGIDHYKTDSSLEEGTVYSAMFVLVSAAFVQLPLMMVKISILFFYKRVFTMRPFRMAVWLMVPVVAIWGIIFFLLILLQSDPVRGSWTGEGHLVFDSFALGLAQIGSSIALDVLILCFPLPVIFGLHMGGKRKIAVAAIFWLGIFCCIAAAVRLWLVYTSTEQVINSQGSGGFSAIYYQTKNVIFIIIEPQCSIIAACLPCYGPLFKHGRAPESLVRSGRSGISLESIPSRRDNGVKTSEQNASGSGASNEGA